MVGKTNPADILSQLPLENQLFQERNIAEEYINYITINAVPKTFTLEEIASVAKADPILQQVQCCLNGAEWPDVADLKPYKWVKDELCANSGVILRGSRIVMLSTLWQGTLSNTHEGHQGIVRTKQNDGQRKCMVARHSAASGYNDQGLYSLPVCRRQT